MQERILEYLRANNGSFESEDEVLAWWKGLQGLVDSLDMLTLALEDLEERGAIVKEVMEKDFFVYRIAPGR